MKLPTFEFLERIDQARAQYHPPWKAIKITDVVICGVSQSRDLNV